MIKNQISLFEGGKCQANHDEENHIFPDGEIKAVYGKRTACGRKEMKSEMKKIYKSHWRSNFHIFPAYIVLEGGSITLRLNLKLL